MDIAELDTTELLALAVEAMDRQKYDDALALLKQLLQCDPQEARAHYLMGSIYAQIRLFDRAEAAMQEALHQDPDLAAARFQLGLIYITSHRPTEAEAVWQPLDQRGEEDPLFLFKSGLLRLAEDDFAGCIDRVEKGIAANHAHPSLNRDMEKLLAKIRNQPASAASPSRHVFLDQYSEPGADDTPR